MSRRNTQNPKLHVISSPTGFNHSVQVTNPGKGEFDVDSLTPELIEVFRAAGVRKKDLKDPKTAAFAMNFVAEQIRQEKQKGIGSPSVKPRPPSQRPSPPSGPAVVERSASGKLPSPPPRRHNDAPGGGAGPAPMKREPAEGAKQAPKAAPRSQLSRLKSSGVRPKSTQPVSSLSRDLEDTSRRNSVRKAPASVAPRPPTRPSGVAPSPQVSRQSSRSSKVTAPSAPAPTPGDRLTRSGSVSPRPVSEAKSLSQSDRAVLMVAGRKEDNVEDEEEEMVFSTNGLVATEATDISALPPPPVLPQHVKEVIARRNTVDFSASSRDEAGSKKGEPVSPKRISPREKRALPKPKTSPRSSPRSSPRQGTPDASPRSSPRPSAAAAASADAVVLPSGATPAVSVEENAPAAASNAPAPPPPPPPVLSPAVSPRRSPRAMDGGDGEGEGEVEEVEGDMMSELLRKSQSLKPVNIEKLSKRISMSDKGQLASALSEALAKMRPAMERGGDEEDDSDDDDDDW